MKGVETLKQEKAQVKRAVIIDERNYNQNRGLELTGHYRGVAAAEGLQLELEIMTPHKVRTKNLFNRLELLYYFSPKHLSPI